MSILTIWTFINYSAVCMLAEKNDRSFTQKPPIYKWDRIGASMCASLNAVWHADFTRQMYINMLTKFMQNGCKPHVFLVKNTAINPAYEKCRKDRIIKMLSKLLGNTCARER